MYDSYMLQRRFANYKLNKIEKTPLAGIQSTAWLSPVFSFCPFNAFIAV
jgi:hypothetical protein